MWEESVIPNLGYNDVVTKAKNFQMTPMSKVCLCFTYVPIVMLQPECTLTFVHGVCK